MGSLTDGEQAVRNGASFITHLFNAMLPVTEFLLFMFNILITNPLLLCNPVSPSGSRSDWLVGIIENSFQ